MKAWTRRLSALAAAGMMLCGPAAAAPDIAADPPVLPAARVRGKLDLDVYASGRAFLRSPAEGTGRPFSGWTPGDPRVEKCEPVWVQHMSRVGYAGMGLAGLVGSIASGGVAPAVGFGLVLLVQSYRETRALKSPRSGQKR